MILFTPTEIMLFAFVMPISRRSEADEFARELLSRLSRWVLLGVGVLVILLGIAISPLPGPGGIPVIVVGLMILLRNSFAAKRRFVRFQRAHPRLVFPIRRLLRREPEVLPVAWQQVLRMERLMLPSRWRMLGKWRRSRRRRAMRRAAA